MARITLGSMITDIRGSIGNHTFGNWKGVAYIRAKADVVTNPQTEKQQWRREAFTKAVQMWNRELTEEEKALWEEYAQSKRKPNSRDEVVGGGGIIPELGRIMSGFNAFVGVNMILAGTEETMWMPARRPPTNPPPELPYIYDAVWDDTTGKITCGYEVKPVPPAIPLGRKLEFWMKALIQGAHPQIAVVVNIPAEGKIGTAEFTHIRVGSGGTVTPVPIASLKPVDIQLQACVVRQDGERSAPSALLKVKVETPPAGGGGGGAGGP